MFLKLYCDKKSKKYANKILSKTHLYNDSTLAVINNPTFAIDTKTSAYCVFDLHGKIVPESLFYRGKNHQFIPKKPRNIKFIDEDVLYVGNIYPHFGHFLVEHLNRLWSDAPRKNIKYVFMNNQNLEVKNYLYEFMSAFGIKKQDIIILTETTQFRKAYIPCQTFNISDSWAKTIMPNGYRLMAKNIKGLGYEKVYMSRTKLPEKNRTIGEDKIEKIFAKNGYKIIYPETMTIHEQIASVRDAKYLAGCAGTALHWCLFMQPGGNVITLKRNSKNDNSIQTQYILNNVCDLNSVFVWTSVETHKSHHGGNHAPQIIGVNENLKKFFDDFGFKYNVADTTFDKKSMAEYLDAYEKYTKTNGNSLQIWICKKLIKILSCLIPGRVNRRNFRNYMKRKYKTK